VPSVRLSEGVLFTLIQWVEKLPCFGSDQGDREKFRVKREITSRETPHQQKSKQDDEKRGGEYLMAISNTVENRLEFSGGISGAVNTKKDTLHTKKAADRKFVTSKTLKEK